VSALLGRAGVAPRVGCTGLLVRTAVFGFPLTGGDSRLTWGGYRFSGMPWVRAWWSVVEGVGAHGPLLPR